jgi:hypothetical protein
VIDGLAVTSYLAFATGQVLAVGQATIGPVNVALIGVEIGAAQGVVTPPPPVVRPGGGGHPHKPPKRKSREERIADAQRDEPKKVVVKKTKKKAEPTEDEKELAFILQIIKDML